MYTPEVWIVESIEDLVLIKHTVVEIYMCKYLPINDKYKWEKSNFKKFQKNFLNDLESFFCWKSVILDIIIDFSLALHTNNLKSWGRSYNLKKYTNTFGSFFKYPIKVDNNVNHYFQ